MNSEYVEVSTSQPVIKNTLPLLYDSSRNWSYLEKNYIRGISSKEPEMALELKYISFTKRNEIAGILSFKSSFHIYSSHTKIRCFRILHQCIVREIKDFIVIIKGCELINYPLNRISVPSFDQVLPIFRTLYGHE